MSDRHELDPIFALDEQRADAMARLANFEDRADMMELSLKALLTDIHAANERHGLDPDAPEETAA